MKRFNNSEDFGLLADRGWDDLATKLDVQLPVKTPAESSFYQKSIAASLFILIGLLIWGYFLPQKETLSVQPLPQIVNHFSFKVEPPKVALLPQTIKDTNTTIKSTEHNEDDFSGAQNATLKTNPTVQKIFQESLFAKQFLTRELTLSADLLPIHLTQVENTEELHIASEAKIVDLPMQLSSKNARLGINLNSSVRGVWEGAGIGGGVSVVFPIGKWFSVEPGVGYTVMKMGTPIQKVENSNYGFAFAATPALNVKYRVRQSIAMPLSFHFQPIRQFALTGGVDVGLLISQRMEFETDNRSYDPFKSYKKQLNDSELNQMNRFNLAAHGGVSWFPSQSWKLGVYYGQNLTNESKAKQSKLKFSNHSFKVRMARYF